MIRRLQLDDAEDEQVESGGGAERDGGRFPTRVTRPGVGHLWAQKKVVWSPCTEHPGGELSPSLLRRGTAWVSCHEAGSCTVFTGTEHGGFGQCNWGPKIS